VRSLRRPSRQVVAASFLLVTLIAWHVDAVAGQLSLTWLDNSTNELGFSVERSTGTTGIFGEVSTTGPNVTAYTDLIVADATTYCYRVRAFNATAYSDYSNVACATVAQTFGLAVVKIGAGSGTVTSVPAGISCGTSCSGSYASGTAVTLTASPATGSTFTGWGGGCAGTGACIVSMTQNRSVTAAFAPITVSALIPDRTSPQPVGTAITWTATATGGSGSYQYQFWRRRTDSGGYVVVQPYGPSASYTWTPGASDVGDHQIAVWVRNAGSSAVVEAGGIAAVFTITAGSAPPQVTALTPNQTSPQRVGTPITWTATVTGGSGSYQYQFFRRRTDSGGYVIVQAYSASATYTWTSGPTDVGDHQIAVWVRNAGSSAVVEAGGIAAVFTITAGSAPPQVNALTPNPTSPQRVGTPITWTATATGGSGSYQYQFFRRRTASGGYVIVQAYSASATYTWTPGPTDVGDHQIAVWVRNAGSTAAVEAGGIAAVFTVTP